MELLIASGDLPKAERRKLLRASGYDQTRSPLSEAFDSLPVDVMSTFTEEEKKLFAIGSADAFLHLEGHRLFEGEEAPGMLINSLTHQSPPPTLIPPLLQPRRPTRGPFPNGCAPPGRLSAPGTKWERWNLCRALAEHARRLALRPASAVEADDGVG